MRILFLGTGPFAVPAIGALHQSHHDLVGLVTRPAPKNLRRKQKTPPNPMREAAQALDLHVWEPDDINAEDGLRVLQAAESELLVVCDYGQILSARALETATLGGINLHGSLLPKYRGAAPVHWAIYNGDTVTGVTVIHMTPRLDGGPMLVQRQVEIGADETMPELEDRLAALGADAVIDAITQLESWDGVAVLGQVQSPSEVTKAPRLRKEQGLIDWSRSAESIRNQIRAFQPWPGSFTWLHRANHEPVRLLIGRASVIEPAGRDAQPGSIVASDAQELWVATGQDWLRLEEVQPAGKRLMKADEFLRGHPLSAADRLGGLDPR